MQYEINEVDPINQISLTVANVRSTINTVADHLIIASSLPIFIMHITSNVGIQNENVCHSVMLHTLLTGIHNTTCLVIYECNVIAYRYSSLG